MNKLRLADVRTPIARIANLCATSSEVVTLVNEAHSRLVAKGRFLGTVQRYRICTSASGCVSWPRQIETIEAWWYCRTPGTVRNNWYEAAGNGPGLRNSDTGFSGQLIDRGTAVVFDQPDNNTSKIMVQSDVAEAAGSQMLIRGYDDISQWVRTQVGGEWIDGEYVDISNVPHYTTNKYTVVTETIKPVTNGPTRLWQWDTALGMTTKALAYYEPDETLPIYRQSIIPGLGDLNGGCNSSSTTCSLNQITVQAKLRHIDVVRDNDFFLLGNMPALKLMVQAILKEERNLFDEAMAYELKAVQLLQEELNSYEGDGQVPILRTESPQTWGAGGVLNTVSLGYRLYY